MKTLTYLPVNWVNGLKLTSQHFFANQTNIAKRKLSTAKQEGV